MNGSPRPSRGTIARTVVLFVALINQIIVIFGGDALPFDDMQVYEAVSTLLTAGAAIVAWWKNNSYSQQAILNDLAMHKRDKASRS
ncbi:MAG: phage holin [Coriobacteriales bacterium]